ncbi:MULTISPECIES: BglG family transcription antiterminator [Paraliobacillus]|uniref:BglG family transcription antiterminator n=1 Tax=Paraliobacillus TaxID=200903 RepID=UPI001E4263F1|nr:MULTISPECIES: BglG family transcription antiterminator [Paraliobacillus]
MIRLYISGRERKIIELLLLQENGATIQQLASNLEVSGRTIHRDLKSVEDTLDYYQLSLNKKSGVGVKVNGSKENKRKLSLAITQVEHTDYTPDERQAIILSTLLETSEPIKLFTLANELHVTIATVSNDLDKISEILETYELKLIRKRGYGVNISGSESNKRSALSFLISKYVDELDFIIFIKENIEKKSKQQLDSISERLLGLVDQSKLVTIEKSIDHVRNELPYELADSAHIGLVVHLALAIERLQQGERIRFDLNYLNEIKDTKEYEIAKNIINDLEVAFHMSIPKDEIGYITMHLLGAKIRSDHDYLVEESSLDIAFKARELINYVGDRLEVNLTENKHLFNDLVTHLKPTMYRIQKGMHIKNPLLTEILNDYKELFITLEDGCKEVFLGTEFPQEEIAYLVLHFASATIRREEPSELTVLVICSSGIGTSKMLATRLIQEIPEIAKIDNRSLFELDEINLNSYNLVISTIAFREKISNYILVSPILTEKEIDRIKTIVRQQRKTGAKKQLVTESIVEGDPQERIVTRLQRMQNYSKVTLDLLIEFKVHSIKEILTKEEILEVACENLKEAQNINNSAGVFKALVTRENLGGIGIPDTSLALYHARSEFVRKPSFTIYALEHPVTIVGMDDQDMQANTFLLMLLPEHSNSESMEILSYISGLIISDQQSITTFQSQQESIISQFLYQHLNSFINDKL